MRGPGASITVISTDWLSLANQSPGRDRRPAQVSFRLARQGRRTAACQRDNSKCRPACRTWPARGTGPSRTAPRWPNASCSRRPRSVRHRAPELQPNETLTRLEKMW